MAFFKRNKTSEPSTATSRETSERQAKWDELEAMVALASEAKTPTAPETVKPKTSEPAPADSAKFAAHDLRTADVETFASDLRADIPEGATPIDVTPDETPKYQVPAFEPKPRPQAPEIVDALIPKTVAEIDAIPPVRDHATYVTPPATGRADRADIGAMRLDVARIASDIQSGEELYRRAQKRIENLTNFVEKAEIDFSLLGRLEPENRRLKARNRTLESEIDSTNQKIGVMRIDLEDHQRRLAEKTRLYEAAQGKLTVAQKNLQDFERALDKARETADRNALQSERSQTSLDVERRENEVLRARVTEAAAELDTKQTAFLEAKKVADSLAQDCADYRHQSDTALKDVTDLRKSLATAQTQNNAMKAEMMTLHEDIRTFKTQSEFTIISREDEMTAMAGQIDQLKKQLEIKDEIVRNAARDVTELRKIRTAQDLERERLESQLQSQAFQLDEANSELLQSRQDVSDFDRRYRDVATALNVAQARRIPTEPAAHPDIQPAPQLVERPDVVMPTAPTRQPAPEATARPEPTSEEVADRILDYKLGIRKDLK